MSALKRTLSVKKLPLHPSLTLSRGKSGALPNATVLALRVQFRYEADLAGGSAHAYASEIKPLLHVFATHGLGVTRASANANAEDDGVFVVTSDILSRHDPNKQLLEVTLPFNPANIERAKLAEGALWALPGARSASGYRVPDKRGRWQLPADASLAFNAYAETSTQHGQACRTRAGESLFLLREVLDPSSRAASKTQKDDVKPEWQVTGDAPLVKGFISVHSAQIVALKSGAATVIAYKDHVKFAPIDAKSAIFQPDDHIEAAATAALATAERLSHDVNASLGVFFPPDMAPLGKADPAYLRRMHCPYYRTTAGLLWGSTYALRLPRSTPPAAYYERALSATLLRADARAEHLLRAISAQEASPDALLPSTRYVGATLSGLLCIYANDMVYLDDFTNDGGSTYTAEPESAASPDAPSRAGGYAMHLVRKTGAHGGHNTIAISEDYKIARLYYGDDCEGVAKEIYMQYWQFRRADLSSLDASRASTKLLLHLQSLTQNNVYVPMLVLAGVTNKKLEAGVRDMPPDQALAHTYTAFVPTARVLEHLSDADASAQFGGLSESIRTSVYARGYKAQKWHTELDTLIAEGTARSSAFVLPVALYYSSHERRVEAVSRATARLGALAKLMRGLPPNIVQVEIPQRRMDDPEGNIAADTFDTSDFYKGNSAAYVSAFRETGVLDLAFAWNHGSAASAAKLTHGIHFNRFVQSPRWDPRLLLVPYNRLTAEQGTLADAALEKLEPVPALRVDAAAASRAERTASVPVELRAVSKLFADVPRERIHTTGEATRVLERDASAMPPPPRSIVLSVRAEDLSQTRNASAAIVSAVAAQRDLFVAARVVSHYLSDAPVRGDATSMPPVLIYDIELRLR